MSLDQSSQLPLDLSHSVSHLREDLIESEANRTAVAMVDSWPNWPGNVVVLAGPVGSGKTHIASTWSEMSDALTLRANEFASQQDDLIKKVGEGNNVLLEDLVEGFQEEQGLFHLINSVKSAGSYCLITSRYWPKEWNIKLPDLRSRLMAAQLVELSEPDDNLLRQVMVKLFADRQISVEAHVIDYCVLRMERSLESAARLVSLIDAKALAERKTITRKIAALALDELGMA